MSGKIRHTNFGYSEWIIPRNWRADERTDSLLESPKFMCDRNKLWRLTLRYNIYSIKVLLNLLSKDSSPFDLSESYIYLANNRLYSLIKNESRVELENYDEYYTFTEQTYKDVFDKSNSVNMTLTETMTFRFFIDAKIINNASYNKDPQESPVSCFENLFNNSDLSDVQFVVGDETFFAHKAILANGSTVFTAMFKNDLKESKENVVEINDMSAEGMHNLLRYMYTHIARIDKNIVFDLLMASDKYSIPNLKKSCEKYLLDTLTIENCIDYVLAADLYNMYELKSEIIVFIGRKCKLDFMNSKPFVELQKSNLKLYAEITQHFMFLVLRSKST
ncbi:hypothetical protein TKK_0005334 [Trichogramma kaykai]|uniref:BTB domain-containing protein n=1 Tax=Trichogramma kaykai TaxID=54128 RepID=A0ABD2XHF3_9HYME